MRLIFMSLLLFAVPLVLQAEYTLVHLPEPVGDPASLAVSPSASGKLDLPADALLLPLFEVNKLDPLAETTLFSVRNVSNTYAIDLVIAYFTNAGGFEVESGHMLGQRQTLSINVNDVAGLTPDRDGVARGFVLIQPAAEPKETEVEGGKGIPFLDQPKLVGDYFQVTQNQDFATGDRLKILGFGEVNSFCERFEARFLNGGAFSGGTDFVFFVNMPQGADPVNDPPTAVVTVSNEAGNNVSTTLLFTADPIVRMPASEFTEIPFGTLEIFFPSTTGIVFMTYSALGRFSVGMDAACRDRYAADPVIE